MNFHWYLLSESGAGLLVACLIGSWWFGCGGHHNPLPAVTGSGGMVSSNSSGVPAGRGMRDWKNQGGSSLRSRVQRGRLRRLVLPYSCCRVVKGTTAGIKMDGWTESATTTGRRDFAHREGRRSRGENGIRFL